MCAQSHWLMQLLRVYSASYYSSMCLKWTFISYAIQMKILFFISPRNKALPTVKGWMLPSRGAKGYASQCRVKKEKGRMEKMRSISSFFNLGAVSQLLPP